MNPNSPGDAFLDADGDGNLNYAEYLDGTDPSCFEWIKWLSQNNLTTPALQDPHADPDKDGVVNLMEYALGTDPRTGDATLARTRCQMSLANDGTGACLTMTIQRPGTRHCNVQYVVETSNDLQHWNSGPGVDVVCLMDTSTLKKVRDAAHVGQPGVEHRFIRMNFVYKP